MTIVCPRPVTPRAYSGPTLYEFCIAAGAKQRRPTEKHCASVGGVILFFFQAEDGIRDTSVTGVQTCALPILVAPPERRGHRRRHHGRLRGPLARRRGHGPAPRPRRPRQRLDRPLRPCRLRPRRDRKSVV